MSDISNNNALFTALIGQGAEVLNDRESHFARDHARLRMVICTDASGAINVDLGLNVDSSECITPFFEGPRAFFKPAGTSVQEINSGGRSNVLIDFSLSFDSNFAEKIRAAIMGENIEQVDRNRVNGILMLKARNRRVQFDVIPFLTENIRLTRNAPNNVRPLNTLIAFRLLDHLNWDAFCDDPSRFVFDSPYEELRDSLRPEAEDFLSMLQTSEYIVHQEAMSAGTQALLLRFAQLWHGGNKQDNQHILSELLWFSIQKLGAIPLTELHLIWSGIISDSGSQFFSPIKGRSPQMLKKVRGMAWDMTLLRGLEQIAITSSSANAFFIPYFVSIDRRWRDLMRLNTVNLMLVDDAHKHKLFARSGEQQFQQALRECMPTELWCEMTADKVEARQRLAAQTIQLDDMQQLVAEEEARWLKLDAVKS